MENKRNLFIKDTFEQAWPAIKNNCYKVGSKNPEEDAKDLYHDIYIKYLEKLNSIKEIDFIISNEQVSMSFYKKVQNGFITISKNNKKK